MQRSDMRSASQRFHVIIFIERCFCILKLNLFASDNLRRSAFALFFPDQNDAPVHLEQL
jgi:hypothetical protein